MDLRPDCDAWSFSITKAYSASVRAGFIIYKNEVEASKQAFVDAVTVSYSMTNGLYSEWSWYGQMQLWEMIMSKPYTEPDSWIGAFSSIVDEKWNVLIEAFENCPVLTLSNPKAGAYAFFVYNPEYTGIQDSFISSFFRDVLGILATTYNWGFRGAIPADFYGEGYTESDFTRLQLYRDVTVYDEIARRAKIVCNDLDASVGDFVSINQWAEAGRAVVTRRRQLSSSSEEDTIYASREDRERHLQESVPTLNHRQLQYLVDSHESSDAIDANVKLCAPDFSTSCLFDKVGTRFSDV
jgi:hypothetical protein